MGSSGAVLLDSSVWIDALRGRDPVLKDTVRALLAEDRVVRCDVVGAELRVGLREKERRTVLDLLEALPNLAIEGRDWEAAGELGASLRRRGVTLPLTDLLIARVCLRTGTRLMTRDQHFDQVEGLALHR